MVEIYIDSIEFNQHLILEDKGFSWVGEVDLTTSIDYL